MLSSLLLKVFKQIFHNIYEYLVHRPVTTLSRFYLRLQMVEPLLSLKTIEEKGFKWQYFRFFSDKIINALDSLSIRPVGKIRSHKREEQEYWT